MYMKYIMKPELGREVERGDFQKCAPEELLLSLLLLQLLLIYYYHYNYFLTSYRLKLRPRVGSLT